jgi:preprotein translocase subunit YajC
VGEAGITVIWVGGIALLAWFLFVRPRRRMVARQRDLFSTLSEGDQIVTAGGMYGTVVALDGDEVRLEIAPEVVVRVARRAIAGRVGPAAEDPAEAPEQAE